MQPGEGYHYDSGPNNAVHPHQLPAGSRLNQYLANNNRQGKLLRLIIEIFFRKKSNRNIEQSLFMFSGPSFGPGTPINVNVSVFYFY